MTMGSNDMNMFTGEMLEKLTNDDLMNGILCFLQSISNYNSVSEKKRQISVIEIFQPYINTDCDEFGGVGLEELDKKQLEDVLMDTFIAYTHAVYGLECNPHLPLIVDNDFFIQKIEHTA